MRSLRWLIGAYRAMWGFCPSCNSDAPAIDTCPVCHEGMLRPASWRAFVERGCR